jgi:CheY-like chemotaxis protein
MAVTASVMPQDRQMVTNAGFDGYQSKPINVKEFLKAVKETLDRSTKAGKSP